MARRTKNNRDEVYSLKGVDQLFDTMTESEKVSELLALKDIVLPESQSRRFFDPQAMADLTQSVQKKGILSPLLVRPLGNKQYELVAGERRYRAAKAVGLKQVPVVIRELSDLETKELALVENLQREDLNPIDETEGILSLLALQENLPVDEVISRFYRLYNEQKGNVDNSNPNVWVKNFEASVTGLFNSLGRLNWESFVKTRLPLLNLPEDVLEALRSGKIEYTKACALAKIKDEDARKKLMASAIAESLSLREIKERIKAATPQQQKEEVFTRADNAHRQIKKSKKFLMENPRKRKKLESLLAQIEKLLEVEK
ncbi:MAG: ParB/RepB/Spo0J family partition protein [Xenococcaceae cyanobacterium]